MKVKLFYKDFKTVDFELQNEFAQVIIFAGKVFVKDNESEFGPIYFNEISNNEVDDSAGNLSRKERRETWIKAEEAKRIFLKLESLISDSEVFKKLKKEFYQDE